MPPKQKYSQESVLNAAFEIMRQNGINAVGARQVADKLNCSTQPIFSYFKDMDELKQALIRKAKDLYHTYVQRGLNYKIPFKGVGFEYINFAKEEPQMFNLLFMSAYNSKMNSFLNFDENRDIVFDSLMDSSGFDKSDAERLYLLIWIFTHGIAVMHATKTISFTQSEIDQLLSDAYIGYVMKIKSNKEKS